MSGDSIQDSTRYVVSDVHHGSVLPGERREMERDVYLLPGADVRGGVWSNELSVSGPDVRVADSVYSQGSVTVQPDQDSTAVDAEVTFGGGLTTPDALLVEAADFKTRFLSDLYVERLNLTNTFVFGNVYAKGAVIRNSVVLGSIFCKGALELANSFVHTFQAHRAEIGENVSMFAPFALGRNEIALDAPVRALTFADIFQEDGDLSEDSGEVVHLDEEDIFEIQGATPDATAGDGAPATQWVLSMTERILDSSLVQEKLQHNKELLRRLSLSRHVETEGQDTKKIQQLEEKLWTAVSTSVSEDKSERSTRSLDRLLRRFGLSVTE
jgi:hypothetical protein